MYSYRVYKHGEMYFFYAVDLKYYLHGLTLAF